MATKFQGSFDIEILWISLLISTIMIPDLNLGTFFIPKIFIFFLFLHGIIRYDAMGN